VKKLFFLCIVLIAYFSLYPWTFVSSQASITILHGFRPIGGRSAYLDLAVNFFFYVPLGVLGVLAWRRNEGRWWRWVGLTGGGAALSLALETMQAWIPQRDSTIQDVLINTLGTMAGVRFGLSIARYLPSDSITRFPSSLRPMPVVLASAWLVAQWFPFLLILRIRLFQAVLAQLTQLTVTVVVRPVGGPARLHRQQRLRPGTSRPHRRSFVTASGSMLNLKVSIRGGCSAWARQIRYTVLWDLLTFCAKSRADRSTPMVSSPLPRPPHSSIYRLPQQSLTIRTVLSLGNASVGTGTSA
jgi:VanZ family protein